MAATQAELEASLDAISKAYNSGRLIVRQGENLVQYRSLDEMARIIARLENQINGMSTTPRRRVRYIWQSSKGL